MNPPGCLLLLLKLSAGFKRRFHSGHVSGCDQYPDKNPPQIAVMKTNENNVTNDWVNIRRDHQTGIESIHAHFCGHAYDAHDHDEVLVGVTQQGLQRFHCGRALHTSQPGRAILIEPGAVPVGHAIEREGFTFLMLCLPQAWVSGNMQRRGLGNISELGATFSDTLTDDQMVILAIRQAFFAIHHQEGQRARDQTLDELIFLLSRHISPVSCGGDVDESLKKIYQVRDFLHDNMQLDISLEELSAQTGIDRFRLSRQFKKVFGQSPHAWRVRLRLKTARSMLARGGEPAIVASAVGFADQSHMGRWFQRAYRITPAQYQRSAQIFQTGYRTIS